MSTFRQAHEGLGREAETFQQSELCGNEYCDEGIIPTVIDQNPCAHLRLPIDMIFHGRSWSVLQA